MRAFKVVCCIWLACIAIDGHGACSFGTSAEPSLQNVFDSVLGPGGLSAANDCLAATADQVWTAQGQVAAEIIIEIAGFASQNEFGLYDPYAQSNRVTVFSGQASAGAVSTIELVSSGSAYSVMVNGASRGQFTTKDFGFYLHTPQDNTFFSQPQFNGDGADHMYSYRGRGQPFTSGPLVGSTFGSAMYMLAFEDLPFSVSDKDFQDFVATVDFAPVPLPASVFLLAAAIAFGALRRARLS